MDWLPYILIVLFGLLAIAAVVGYEEVPQSQLWTIQRFGRYVRTSEPGPRIVWPIIEEIYSRISVLEDPRPVSVVGLETLDGVTVSEIKGTARIRLARDSDAARMLTYGPGAPPDSPKGSSVEANIMLAVDKVFDDKIRAKVNATNLLDLRKDSKTIFNEIAQEARLVFAGWGLEVMSLEITNVSYPQDVLDALEQPFLAKQKAAADLVAAENAKQIQILQAEGEAKAIVAKANAKRDADIAEADGAAQSLGKETGSKTALLGAYATAVKEMDWKTFRMARDLTFMEEKLKALALALAGSSKTIIGAPDLIRQFMDLFGKDKAPKS